MEGICLQCKRNSGYTLAGDDKYCPRCIKIGIEEPTEEEPIINEPET